MSIKIVFYYCASLLLLYVFPTSRNSLECPLFLHILSGSFLTGMKVVRAYRNKSTIRGYYRSNSFYGLPKGSYLIPNPRHFHLAHYTYINKPMRPYIIPLTSNGKYSCFNPSFPHFLSRNENSNLRPTVTINIADSKAITLNISMQTLREFIYPFAAALNFGNLPNSRTTSCQTSYHIGQSNVSITEINNGSKNISSEVSTNSDSISDEISDYESNILKTMHQKIFSETNLTDNSTDFDSTQNINNGDINTEHPKILQSDCKTTAISQFGGGDIEASYLKEENNLNKQTEVSSFQADISDYEASNRLIGTGEFKINFPALENKLIDSAKESIHHHRTYADETYKSNNYFPSCTSKLAQDTLLLNNNIKATVRLFKELPFCTDDSLHKTYNTHIQLKIPSTEFQKINDMSFVTLPIVNLYQPKINSRDSSLPKEEEMGNQVMESVPMEMVSAVDSEKTINSTCDEHPYTVKFCAHKSEVQINQKMNEIVTVVDASINSDAFYVCEEAIIGTTTPFNTFTLKANTDVKTQAVANKKLYDAMSIKNLYDNYTSCVDVGQIDSQHDDSSKNRENVDSSHFFLMHKNQKSFKSNTAVDEIADKIVIQNNIQNKSQNTFDEDIDCMESSTSNFFIEFDSQTIELSEIIYEYVVKQCYEIKDLILFPEILYDEHAVKMFLILKESYLTNYTNVSDENKSELRINITNYILKKIKLWAEINSNSENLSNASDKLFSISEFVADILDKFFDQYVTTINTSETWNGFSNILVHNKVCQSTPEDKTPSGKTIADKSNIKKQKNDKSNIKKQKNTGKRNDKKKVTHTKEVSEDLTLAFQTKKMESGSELYWISVNKSPKNGEGVSPRKTDVINVDDIPLKPPIDLITSKRIGSTRSLSPILEEARCNLYNELIDVNSGSSSPILTTTTETFEYRDTADLLAGGDYVQFEKPETEIVVVNEAKFFRGRTSNHTCYIQSNSVTFHANVNQQKTNTIRQIAPQISSKACTNSDDENWMGYEKAKF